MDAEVRKTGISGTDISAICGVNPYRTAFQVYLEKTGKAEAVEVTPQMRWGLILEPVVATQFRLAHPKEFGEMKMNETTFVNPDNQLVVGTPDYLMPETEHGLEVKTVGTFMAKGFGDQGTDDVPKHHYLQCEWYMILMGWTHWHLAALIGGQDYRSQRRPRREAARYCRPILGQARQGRRAAAAGRVKDGRQLSEAHVPDAYGHAAGRYR